MISRINTVKKNGLKKIVFFFPSVTRKYIATKIIHLFETINSQVPKCFNFCCSALVGCKVFIHSDEAFILIFRVNIGMNFMNY